MSKILENESLARYTSMRVGGTAKYVAFPESRDELIGVIEYFRSIDMPSLTVGNCSNLIFRDKDYELAVIITCGVRGIEVDGTRVRVMCGESMSSLANRCMENSLTGLEFCYGIPGTVGGGVYMNAGAYGGEIKDAFVSAEVLDANGNIKIVMSDYMEFGYRRSNLMNTGDILLSAEFELTVGDKCAIKAKMDDLMLRRKTNQPLEYPSCGSTFKRPEGHFAGALIEQAGLKGFSVGGAEVSEKHAGFIINKNGATATDVLELIEKVQKTVLDRSGVMLEPEVRIIG